MAMLTKDLVIERFADFYCRRDELLADCQSCPELVQERIWQIEEILELAQKVDLDADYIQLIRDLITDLELIKMDNPS